MLDSDEEYTGDIDRGSGHLPTTTTLERHDESSWRL